MFSFRYYFDKIDVIYKITLFLLFIIVIITVIVYFIIRPSSKLSLSKDAWCVDQIYYNQKLIGPKSTMVITLRDINGNIPCYEIADFRKNGDLILPGINSPIITGRWTVNGESYIELNTDTLQYIFKGVYNVDVSSTNLKLTSQTTIIYGHKDQYKPPVLF